MNPFTFEARIPRTVFGSGTIDQVAVEVERLGCQRVLIVAENTDRQLALAEKVKGTMPARIAGICTDAVMHTPEEVTLKALEDAKRLNADCLVSLGGGSTIGLGKALGVRLHIPHIAIPTTYAGSEATPILGETVNSVKSTRSDPEILPTVIVYDVDLTLSLPQQLTYTSGINAIAHCVEALYSTLINPVIEGVALSSISGLYDALRVLHRFPNDLKARGEATSGAWGAGICLGHVGMGLHHKLCHTLGGSFGLPHSEVHTVILPHAIAYNEEAAALAMSKIKRHLGISGTVARAVWDLENEIGTVRDLKSLGMKEEDLQRAADLACKAQYPNPAPLEPVKMLQLLKRAYHGTAPE